MKPKRIKKKLERRIKDFENPKGKIGKWGEGYRKPGSLNPHKS